MSHIDDLFRDGLSGRKADVPNTNDLWARINAAKGAPLPEGEDLDRTFSNKLRDRRAAVPAGMWQRVAAARAKRPIYRWMLAAASFLLLLFAGLGYGLSGNDAPAEAAQPPIETVEEDIFEDVVNTKDESSTKDARPAEVATTSNNTIQEASTPLATSGQETTTAPLTNGINAPFSQSIIREKTPVTPPSVGPASEIGVKQSATIPAINAEAVNLASRTSNAVSALETSLATLDLPATSLPEFDVIPSKFRAHPSRSLQTELLFGLSFASKEFIPLDDSQNLLRDAREQSESPEFGYQITLRGTYNLSDRIRLIGGLTYAEIRNKFEFERISGGRPVDVTTNNHIRMLEAPLLLGYSLSGQRVNVSLNAGPVINLTTSVRGRFLHPDSNVLLDLATDGNYRKNIGVGFMTSLSTTYQIGKKHPVTLLVEPFFKSYPTAFTVKGAPLKEKYWVAGLQLGVRKTLR
ncbi:MAG: hypothetical protein ACJAZ9_000299 [Neolewinella sp.]|jgi:hypothetical protein